MAVPAERLREALLSWLEPGRLYTFVGAGGKSTAMKRAADVLRQSGLRVRMTTTTRVGIEEFLGIPVRIVRDSGGLEQAMQEEAPVLLVAGGETQDHLKYQGIDPSFFNRLPLPPDVVVMVEGDGSRRLPMKVPREHEPVIPAGSAAVFALMGAGAFDGPIDERSCYNFEKALALADPARTFTAEAVASLASHPEGLRKGVMPGMAFRVLINQGDLTKHAATALRALGLMARQGVDGVLVSLQEGELYGITE